MMRLIDRPVKKARFDAREESRELMKQLMAAQEKLEAAGIDSSFMYERNSDGTMGTRFISATGYEE
jgi:hypothetical protein